MAEIDLVFEKSKGQTNSGCARRAWRDEARAYFSRTNCSNFIGPDHGTNYSDGVCRVTYVGNEIAAYERGELDPQEYILYDNGFPMGDYRINLTMESLPGLSSTENSFGDKNVGPDVCVGCPLGLNREKIVKIQEDYRRRLNRIKRESTKSNRENDSKS